MAATPIDISGLHALERSLEAKLRRQEAAVKDSTEQLQAVRAMIKAGS